MAKKVFPYRDKDTSDMEDGERVARARYFQNLRSEANQILDEAEDGGEIDDEVLDEQIRQYADSSVIYTHECIKILEFSDNWTAIEDVLGEGMPMPDSFTTVLCQAAYYAYEADLREMVDAHRDEYERED